MPKSEPGYKHIALISSSQSALYITSAAIKIPSPTVEHRGKYHINPYRISLSCRVKIYKFKECTAMKKIKTILIDLTISAVLAIAIILVVDAADNMINHASLLSAEQIMMAK